MAKENLVEQEFVIFRRKSSSKRKLAIRIEVQTRMGKKVSFDESMRASPHEKKATDAARRKLESLYGSLSKNDKEKMGFWRDLEDSKKADRVALEKKASSHT